MKAQNTCSRVNVSAKACAVLFIAAGAAIASAGTIDPGKPLPESLKPDILYFNFDEVDGGLVRAGMPDGREASMQQGAVSGPPVQADGPSLFFKKAMEFNYGDLQAPPELPNANTPGNHLKVATAPELGLEDQSFTMGAWIKVLDDAGGMPENSTKYILGKGGYNKDVAGWAFALQKRTRDQWVLLFQHSSGTAAETLPVVVGYLKAFNVNEWHHVALSYNHETRELIFYLDGNPIIPSPFEPFLIGPSTTPLLIGERGTAHYGNLSMITDEVFIVSGVHDFVPPSL